MEDVLQQPEVTQGHSDPWGETRPKVLPVNTSESSDNPPRRLTVLDDWGRSKDALGMVAMDRSRLQKQEGLLGLGSKAVYINEGDRLQKQEGLLGLGSKAVYINDGGKLQKQEGLLGLDSEIFGQPSLVTRMPGKNNTIACFSASFQNHNIREDLHHLNLDKINPQDRDKWQAAIKPQLYCTSTSNPRKTGNNRQ
ncbi:hypothetical protein Bbelb_285000 [Branchiostoma belcheri]|nr:hypothetical protein Bbelb_285000 [Branchiostoma belcheri]